MITQDLKVYYKEIDKALVCEKKEKKAFLDELKLNIEQYINDNNVKTIDEIKEHFGSPQEIANSFLGDIDTNFLRKKLSVKKAVIIALIILVAIITLVYIIAFVDSSYQLKSLYEEEIIIHEWMNIL